MPSLGENGSECPLPTRPRKKSIVVKDFGLSREMELVRLDFGLTTKRLFRCIIDFRGLLQICQTWSKRMVRKTGWMDSPSFNWVAACVSALMLILYIQEMLGPEQRPITGYVVFAWALMLAVWLTTAIYKTWFRNGRKE